jgi:hypothetical protein
MHHKDVDLFRKAAAAQTRAYKAQFFMSAVCAIVAGLFFLDDKLLPGLMQSLLSGFMLYSGLGNRRKTKEYSSYVDSVANQCPKCKSGMEEGFLLENGHYNALSSEKSFLGTDKGKVTYRVQTYRCVACGYLESYSR